MRRLLLLLVVVLIPCSFALSQALPSAARTGDLQLGGGFTDAAPDYTMDRIKGAALYGDFDFRKHYGASVEFHQLNLSGNTLYERSYEIGGRYIRHYDIFTPYVKVLYGRGVFNFPPYPPPAPQNEAAGNLAYNMLAGAIGVDIAVHERVNVRAEYEYQHWLGDLGLPNGLTPTLLTIGAAYHFSAGTPHLLKH